MQHTKIIIPIFLALLTMAGCKKDSSTEQENITRVEVHLTASGGFDQEFEWSDPDGGSTSNATAETIVIPSTAGATLHCHVHVYDDTKTPAQDLTEDIEAESNDHLFVYDITGANIGVAYDDTDTKGQNFGIETVWTKGAASTGTLRLRLYHQPTDKSNLSAPGGEVDFDINMPVTVE